MQLFELLLLANMTACKEGKERKGNMFDSERYIVVISVACSLLNVDTFYPEQKEALWKFFNGKDVFFSAHTGYGKLLIHRATPIIYCRCFKRPSDWHNTVLVLSPLLSLMKDQVKHIGASRATRSLHAVILVKISNSSSCIFSV